MSDQLDLNPEARRKCVSDLYGHSPRPVPAYLTGYWILGVLREEQRDPKFARAHEVRDPRVGGLLRFGDGTSKLREREQ